FMGPFEATASWDPKGISGCFRFLQKVWNLKSKIQNPKSKITNQNSKLEKLIHQTIKKVSEDIEDFKFNTAISALMILVNELEKQPTLEIRNLKLVIKLLAPFAPHLTEELWQNCILKVPSSKFQVPSSIHNQPWPSYDPNLIKEEKITLIVQVNGKVRDKIEAEANISEEKAKELAISREKVKKWIEGKEIKKVIFVPEKLINIVV
ncbi:MAG: class I tRNA ligase family protein, partial [Patescibacteria group bacterium]|nr:class I tRNA ligase family protein [Patescibacteria group bacterium]